MPLASLLQVLSPSLASVRTSAIICISALTLTLRESVTSASPSSSTSLQPRCWPKLRTAGPFKRQAELHCVPVAHATLPEALLSPPPGGAPSTPLSSLQASLGILSCSLFFSLFFPEGQDGGFVPHLAQCSVLLFFFSLKERLVSMYIHRLGFSNFCLWQKLNLPSEDKCLQHRGAQLMELPSLKL